MGTKAFSFNSQAKYRSGGHFKEKAEILVSLSLSNQEILADDKGSHFKAMFPDIFADYQNPPLTRDVAMENKAWQIWQNTPFSWWQCQLNFALCGASASCGVSFEHHLQAVKPLLASLYRFHVYHKTKRLLGMRTHITRGPTSGFALSLGYGYGLAAEAGSRMSRTRILEYLHDSIWGI